MRRDCAWASCRVTVVWLMSFNIEAALPISAAASCPVLSPARGRKSFGQGVIGLGSRAGCSVVGAGLEWAWSEEGSSLWVLTGACAAFREGYLSFHVFHRSGLVPELPMVHCLHFDIIGSAL